MGLQGSHPSSPVLDLTLRWLLWSECEMSHMGSCVEVLCLQLVVLILKGVEQLGSGFSKEEVGHWEWVLVLA